MMNPGLVTITVMAWLLWTFVNCYGNEDFRVSKREVDMVPNCTNYLDINYSIILGTVLPSALLITVTFISVGVCYKRRHALHNRNITKSAKQLNTSPSQKTGLRLGSATKAENLSPPPPKHKKARLQPKPGQKLDCCSTASEVDKSKKVPMLPHPNAHNTARNIKRNEKENNSCNPLSVSYAARVIDFTTTNQNQIPMVKKKSIEIFGIESTGEVDYVEVSDVGIEDEINEETIDEQDGYVNDINPANTLEIGTSTTDEIYTKPAHLPVQIIMGDNIAYKPSCNEQLTNIDSSEDSPNHAYDEPHSYWVQHRD